MGITQGTKRKVLRITPTITGVTYGNNDILFDTTEIPFAVSSKGDCSKLVSAMISSKSNDVFDGELFFCSVNQSMGTVNAARNVSDADWATAKVTGSLTLDGGADDYNYGGGRIFRFDRNQEGFAETAGDENILSDFQVDTGMRDTYYDIGSISRKAGVSPPTGRLLIVFDYFTHGAGNYFSVDSYPVGITATSITYDEIPLYSAQRVDPDVISPTGEYDLRDSIDFRPRVADYAGTNAVSASVSISPLSFAKRDFTAGTASLVDVPKSDDTFLASFNYYLPQNAALWLDSEGEFRTVVGAAAENPENPKPLDDAMQIAEFRLPPYTFAPSDIGVRRLKNRRFTMRDIGKISERVENLEYYSQLNMLEKDTESYQIQDADGLDRFKCGFLVDNFKSLTASSKMDPDYKASIDKNLGELRPSHYTTAVDILLGTNSIIGIGQDADPAQDYDFATDLVGSGCRKTGDLVTLDYTETVLVKNVYASRTENVQPFAVIFWRGSMDLNPSSDVWVDTRRIDARNVNIEGDYEDTIAEMGADENTGLVSTVWNAWQTDWICVDVATTITQTTRTERSGKGNNRLPKGLGIS